MVPESSENEKNPRRIIARCTDCRSAFIARKWDDGRVRPLDRPSGCDCGSTSFVDLTSRK